MHLRIRLISITTNVVLAKTFLLHLESLVDTGLIVSFTKTVVIDLIYIYILISIIYIYINTNR